MSVRRVLAIGARVFLGLLAFALLAFSAWAWWTHPKRPTDSFFVWPAGKDVFKVSDRIVGLRLGAITLDAPVADTTHEEVMACMTMGAVRR